MQYAFIYRGRYFTHFEVLFNKITLIVTKMATIATPKVSYNSTPLPTKSSWIDPTKEPVNVLAIPGAGNSDSQEETVGYCEDTARVIQRARAGTNKAQGMNSHLLLCSSRISDAMAGETVNQFLARDKKELLEEGSDVKSSIKESNDQDLDNIFCMQESKTGRSSGKHVKRGIVRAPTIGKDIGEDLDDLPSYGSTAGSSQGGCAWPLCLNACLYCCR